MLEIFSNVIGEILCSDKQGYLLTHNNELIFVPIHELSWNCNFCNTNIYSLGVGCRLTVFIIAYDYIEGYYIGSLKRTESINPYRELFKLPPSTVIRGIVSDSQYLQISHTIIFPNFTYGTIYHTCKKIPLIVGKTVDTIIYSLWLRSNREELSLEFPTKHSREKFEQKYFVENIDDIKRISKIDPTRLEYGSTISANLTKIEPYGLWFTAGYNIIFIDLMEIFWNRRLSMNDITMEVVQDIYILGYDYIRNYYWGSIRRTKANPYKEFSRFDPSTIFKANILDYTSEGDALVGFSNNTIGKLKKECLVSKVHDSVNVIIKTLFIDAEYDHLCLETPEHHSRKKFVPGTFVQDI
jgi:hypothetical protein